jgi:hypothetical protein
MLAWIEPAHEGFEGPLQLTVLGIINETGSTPRNTTAGLGFHGVPRTVQNIKAQ